MLFVTIKLIVNVDFVCFSGIVYDEQFYISVLYVLKETFSYGYILSLP